MTTNASEPTRPVSLLYVAAIVITMAAWCFVKFRPKPGPPKFRDEQLAKMLPSQEPKEGHAPSSDCRECHEHKHGTWFDSYHRRMTQVVTPETVLGDFNDVTIDVPTFDRQLKLSKRDGYPWVSFGKEPNLTPASRLKRKNYPLVLSTGSHHIQFYWYPVGAERTLAIMPIGYHIEEDRWIPVADSFLTPPGGAFETQTALWNKRCIRCHTTFPDVNRTSEVLQFDSQVQEFGIACAACHGPAADHIAYQRNAKTPNPHFDTNIVDTIVNPATLPHRLSTQVCGGCHSIYKAGHWQPHQPGQPIGKDRRLLDPDKIRANMAEAIAFADSGSSAPPESEKADFVIEGAFWPDGKPRITGGEYNSLLKSPCHTKGEMACVSCHLLHQDRTDPRPRKEWANDQLKTSALGDQACTQCHQADDYAVASHTHHTAGSGGSSCQNCHMPYTSYGLLTAIRSHTVFSPDAAADQEAGRPNACNLCHLDKSLEWTADHLKTWYDIAKPVRASEAKETSLAAVMALRGDAAQRALTAYALGWQPALQASPREWIPPYLATLLKDPYSAVRFIAGRSLQRHAGYESFAYDFIGDTAELAERSTAALEIWRKRKHQKIGPGHSAVLLDSEGRLDEQRFKDLYDRRDDRDITMVE
jgi:hypothetical protein